MARPRKDKLNFDQQSEIEMRWNEILIIVDVINVDVQKNIAGVVDAGIRARHGLRLLRNRCHELVPVMREHDVAIVKERKNRREEQKKNDT